MGNEITRDYLARQFEELRRHLSQGSIQEMAEDYQQHLNEMQNLPLNIAVIGQSGAGKSSFINAIRGVMDEEEEAAEVGAVEQTTEPKVYPHPSFPNIQIWDLPGIRTSRFNAAEYVQHVQFERYDAFIMVTSENFTENDALLAKEIQRMRKKCYYVRSKIDISIESEKTKKDFNMDKTLETIRNYCEERLRRASDFSARVFLISNREVRMYDFPLLQERIAAELPYYKKHIKTMAAQLFSENELRMKKAEIILYIKKVALLSCACGVVPVPGLSILCDIPILLGALKCICDAFGLDDNSLRALAFHTGKEFEKLSSAIQKTPLANTIDTQLLFSLLRKSSLWVAASFMEVAFFSYIPVIGSVFGGSSSFAVTYHFLNTFLDGVLEDARNLREILLE